MMNDLILSPPFQKATIPLSIAEIALTQQYIDFTQQNEYSNIHACYKERAIGLTVKNILSILINDDSKKKYQAKSIVLINAEKKIIGGASIQNDYLITKQSDETINTLLHLNIDGYEDRLELLSYIKGSIVTHGQDGVIDYLGDIDPFFKAIDPIFSEYFYTKDEIDQKVEEAINDLDDEIEKKINEAISDLDDEIEQKVQEAINGIGDEIDQKVEEALNNLDQITVSNLNSQNIITDNMVITQDSTISKTNSNRKDGIKTQPAILDRGENKSPIMSLAIGDMTYIRCSSHFVNLIGSDYIAPGHEFFISNELANGGNGVYLAAQKEGKFVEPTKIHSSLKVFLGAGRYVAMHGADLTTYDSAVLCKKINHE